MTQSSRPVPLDTPVASAIRLSAFAGASLATEARTVQALIFATELAVAAAQSARRALALQLPTVSGEASAGDIGSFGS